MFNFDRAITVLADLGDTDGAGLCTRKIQSAIDRCCQEGGGTIRIPPGTWYTGALTLRSRVKLHIEKGAVVKFSTRFEDYLPVVFTRFEGIECYNYRALLYANGCRNIAIAGEGVIDGQGAAWWPWKKLQHTAARKLYDAEYLGIPVGRRAFGTVQDALRPSLLQPINCTQVLVEGITLRNSPMWTLHPVYCRDVVIRNVKVYGEGPNTDGINPDSCDGVRIEDCFISTGDDCIAIKSGMNEDGRRVGKPCRNIEVRNCRMQNGHGGVVIGSDTSGDIRNVLVRDCTFIGTSRGIRLKSMRGRGGIVENIIYRNISMQDIAYEAIVLDMQYGSSTVEPRTSEPPVFRDITLESISCRGCGRRAIDVRGIAESPIVNLTLKNIDISKAGRDTSYEYCEGLIRQNVVVDAGR
ncbi:MAG: glycoside hydrolase family 28 protein [Chitinivibrionales bacterium]|nr:glycoside hydrolase family 28 protein [Chitinivibrionales bacterium]